jgi:hypothetical protein
MKQHQEFDLHGWEVLVARVGIGGEYQATASRGGCNIHTRRFGGRGAKARAREAIVAAVERRRGQEER